MHNVLALTDRAIVAYLISQGCGSNSNIFPFKKSTQKALPCVIVHSHNGTPVATFDGTYEVLCSVIVRTLGAVDEPQSETDPIDANDLLVDQVSSALHKFGNGASSGGDLADLITQAALSAGNSDFTCQDAGIEKIDVSVDYQHQMDAWTDEIVLRLVVCSGDVS